MPDDAKRKPTRSQLGGLGGRLLEVQENERRRIGRELHDDIAQRLGLLVVELEQAKGLASPSVRLQNRLDRVRNQAEELLSAVQSLSRELHSSKLEYLGLAAAARSLCRKFADQHRIAVNFTETDVPATIPQEISICLFRVLQEGLHNIAKHSGAQCADVKLQASHNEIQLLIRDLGRGFSLEAATRGKGLGLISMRERVHLVKGEISITSRLGSETKVSVRIPLPAKRSEEHSPRNKSPRIRIVHSGPGDTKKVQ